MGFVYLVNAEIKLKHYFDIFSCLQMFSFCLGYLLLFGFSFHKSLIYKILPIFVYRFL